MTEFENRLNEALGAHEQERADSFSGARAPILKVGDCSVWQYINPDYFYTRHCMRLDNYNDIITTKKEAD